MITKEEIDEASEELEINPANVQKDYMFGWALKGIYADSTLRDLLILKGGNCLRKAYFPYTRFSDDLDFGTQQAVDLRLLRERLDGVCAHITEATGVAFNSDQTRIEEKRGAATDLTVYEARLYFRDFYGNPNKITLRLRVDITEFDRIYLPIQERALIHPYSDEGECSATIRCLKLEEMLAAKMKCLLQRRHSADLFDFIYAIFINKEIDVQRREILSVFFRKTIFEREPGAARALLLDLPFDFFRGVWNKYIVCPLQSVFDFDLGLEGFRTAIDEIFGSTSPHYAGAGGRWLGGLSSVFFPAAFRNPILDAGREQKLLRIVYDGQERVVEPYSLAYKRRQDGVAKEYFYCWDRTGGTSGPGIKALVAEKMGKAETLDEGFEPRFQIELSKAGEMAGKTYFGKGFGKGKAKVMRVGSTRPTKALRSKTSGGMKYVFQCVVCGKRFTRESWSSSLNAHKDKYGNACFGRLGTFVEQRWR